MRDKGVCIWALLFLCLLIFGTDLTADSHWRHWREARRYFKNEQYELAYQEYKKTLELKPSLSKSRGFQKEFEKAKLAYYYSQYEKFYNQESWDKALEALKKVVDINPYYMDAENKLSEVKKKASLYHYQAGVELSENGKLTNASSEFKKAISFDPENVEAQDALKKLKKRTEKAEALYKTALESKAKEQWDKALNYVCEAVITNPEILLSAYEVKSILSGSMERHTKSVKKYLIEKQWGNATSEINLCKDLLSKMRDTIYTRKKAEGSLDFSWESVKRKSENYEKEISSLLSTLGDYQDAENLYDEGVKSLKLDNWKDAIFKFESALAKNPNHTEARQNLEKAKKCYAETFIKKARELYKEKKFLEALRDYKRAQVLYPGYEGLNEEISKTKNAIATALFQKGQKFESSDKVGNALFCYIASTEYGFPLERIQYKVEELTHLINNRIAYRIGMVNFDNKSSDPTISDTLYARISELLIKSKPQNVTYIDRGDMGKILEEQKLTITGMLDPGTTITAGKIKGVNALILGRVLDFSVNEDKSSIRKSIKYQSSTRSVANPEYRRVELEVEKWKSTITELRAELRRAEEELTRIENQVSEGSNKTQDQTSALLFGVVGFSAIMSQQSKINKIKQVLAQAQWNLSQAEENLANTPMYKEIPVYDYYNYPVYFYKKKARIKVLFKIVDVETGKTLFVRNYEKRKVVKDTYIEGNPEVGVEPDPLELPSDDLLLNSVSESLLEDAYRDLKKKINKICQESFLDKARQNMDFNNFTDAIEEYVNFLFAVPSLDSRYSEEAIKTIEDSINVNLSKSALSLLFPEKIYTLKKSETEKSNGARLNRRKMDNNGESFRYGSI